MCPTLSPHWMMQSSLRAQSFQQGTFLPPLLNTGGASYANYDQVGISKLNLLLGGVLTYTLLDNTAYFLPPTAVVTKWLDRRLK
jgi:hypothetical protein